MREWARQDCPLIMNEENRNPSMAAGRSASSRMMAADLPPNSSVQRLSVSPQMEPTRRPAAVDPVKPILSTPGLRTSRSPTSRPAGTTLMTPGGRPASSAISASSSASSGVSGAGLMTRVQPAIKAGDTRDMITS